MCFFKTCLTKVDSMNLMNLINSRPVGVNVGYLFGATSQVLLVPNCGVRRGGFALTGGSQRALRLAFF